MKQFIYNECADTDVETILLYLFGDEHVITLNAETGVE